MKFEYVNKFELPLLGWCAEIKGINNVIVYHGDNVETLPRFFVEGAWDGCFLNGGFDDAEFLNGTGGKIETNKQKLIFSTPNHTIGRLVLIRKHKSVFISNSIPVLLYLTGLSLDPTYRKYESDFDQILKGINNYKEFIPLSNNEKLYLFYYTNIVIDNEMMIKKKRKKTVLPFRTYADYYNRINSVISKITSNGTHEDRKVKYNLISTISSGYDATACAVIAKNAGCEKCISFDRPKEYAEDFGGDIAKELGFKYIISVNADDYKKRTDKIEASIVSSGELGTGIVFTSFGEKIKNKVVFFGIKGGVIWSKDRGDANNELILKNDLNNHFSMIEYKLELGFIEVILPLYGFEQWKSIYDISNSEEMKDYSILGHYDRPIPRRIIEAAGVARNSFGIVKRGAGFNFRYDNLNRLKIRMSSSGFSSFMDYYLENRDSFPKRIKQTLSYYMKNRNTYINFVLNKLNINYKLKTERKYISNPGAPSYLFAWGVDEMINKYEKRKK